MIVNRDDRRGRAASFGEVADAYERARPEYPPEAIAWLVGAASCDVLDLGAGTGKLTRGLVTAGHRVVAVEPLAEMRDHLVRACPGVEALAGSAEEIPLPDAAVDVVAVAQAFHWFDHGRALPEIARVLRPGGHLALVWNTRDEREQWVDALSEHLGHETVEERDAAEPLDRSGRFGAVERATFAHIQRLGREELRDLVLSRSYCAVRTPAERAPVLDAVDALFDAHAVGGVVELPYVTECFRAVLSPS